MRAVEIMQMLREAQRPVAVQDLAARLHVSSRTVQDELAKLRSAAPEHGFSLVSRRGRGVSLEVTDAALLDEYLARLDATESEKASDGDRADGIMQVLLLQRDQDGYVVASDLADRLDIGRTSVFSDLPAAERRASELGLRIERERRHGIRVAGTTYDRKVALASYLLDAGSLVAQQVGAQPGMARVRTDVDEILRAHGLQVDYPQFQQLVAFCQATAYYAGGRRDEAASAAGTATTLDPTSAPTPDDDLRAVAAELGRTLVRDCGASPDAQDARDLSRELSRDVRPRIAATVGAADFEKIDRDVDAFFRAYDAENGTDYAQDAVLRTMLRTHFAFLVERLSRKVSYENPLAREFEITNPDSMNVAIRLCSLIERDCGVAPGTDEVALVACHLAAHDERARQQKLRSYARVAVVCSTGGGASYLTQMQLESVFPEAQVRRYSYQERDALRDFEPDLVLSMVPLDGEPGVPVVRIHEMLDETDLGALRDMVRRGTLGSAPTAPASATDLLVPSLFHHVQGPYPGGYQGLVAHMAQELVEGGFAPADFGELVARRESFSSTVYLNGVCMPHPLETRGLRDAIATTVVDGQMAEGARRVRIVFLVCLRRQSVELYRTISKHLYAFMQRPELVERAASCATVQELAGVLEGLE